MKKLFTILTTLALLCAVGCEDKIQEIPNENGGNEQEEQEPEPEPELPDVPPVENICEAMDDVEFIKYCNENFDINNDGILAASEIANVRHIDISDKKIYSVEGIAYFENLNELNAAGSSLIEVDLRRNSKLTMVSFRGCELLEEAMLPNLSIIADSTFYACNRLAMCKIPDSVTTIGNGAFQGCSAVTELSLSENVGSVGEYAFADCSGLETITIYTTDIAKYAFQGATGALIIEPNAKLGKSDIDALAFAKSSIQSATIAEGITFIGDSAFHSCESLEGVIIPNSVTKIGGSAFYGCNNLSIVVPSTVTTIGAYAFVDCENVTFADTTKSITYTASSRLSILASEVGANSIVSHNYNDGVGVVTFDTAPTTICDNTFKNNTPLTSITIPDSVTSIGYGAFLGCTSLANVTMGNGVTSIGENAFYDCSSLTSVTIPNSVTSIGDYAFYDCWSLKDVHITNIEKVQLFARSYILSAGANLWLNGSLVTEYTFPDGVTNISKEIVGCMSITKITIPESVTSIEGSAFYGCSGELIINSKYLVEKSYSNTNFPTSSWLCNSNFSSIVIGVNVSKIGSHLFRDCWNLVSVNIPDSVTLIEWAAFEGCSKLKSISIPVGVVEIAGKAFGGCSSLTSITIPNSATKIGENAFDGCTSLASVYCKPTTPPSGDWWMFDNNASGRKIYVPTESVDAYKAAEYWSEYANYIEPYQFE